METFDNKIAVVTGGGSGIGRALVQQLAASGAHVAFCDLSEAGMQETLELCNEAVANGIRVTAHHCDVASEQALEQFRDEIQRQHNTQHINLLFNNAGISGGQSFVNDDREQWEQTFNICWGGVYLGCRVFMPLLLASEAGHIINTSSVNGFWGCLGANIEHTAYSAAKFAVKGFTESLLVDLRLNAPHIGVSVVMPGHIGTSIAINTQQMWAGEPEAMSADALAGIRKRWTRMDAAAADLSDEDVRALARAGIESFRDNAPTTAAQAAEIILNGVKQKQWRILVGEDAVLLDEAVRTAPGNAYDADFMHPFTAANETSSAT